MFDKLLYHGSVPLHVIELTLTSILELGCFIDIDQTPVRSPEFCGLYQLSLPWKSVDWFG